MIGYRGSELYIGSLRALDLVEMFGTPLYVYDSQYIESSIDRLREAFSIIDNVDIYYSVKANSNPHILRLIYSRGIGMETASVGEVYLAIKSGVKPSRIMITSPGLSFEEIRYLVDVGVDINANSISQVRSICRLSSKPDSIGLRVNTGIASGHHRYVATGDPYSKFGISISDLDKAVDEAHRCGVEVKRLHSHIGSGVSRVEPYIDNLKILLKLAKSIESVEEVDIGGGFSIPYREGDGELPLRVLAEDIHRALSVWRANTGREIKLIVEPGRFIVGGSGVLLSRVLDVFYRGGRQVVVLDTGFNHLIRPVLYGSYHRILPVYMRGDEHVDTDIYGPLCESGDYLALSRKMPRLEIGDVVAILDVGAYGIVLASNYNSKPLPAEVLVDSSGARIIRYRQGFEDLLLRIP